jgi:hypothetical protein
MPEPPPLLPLRSFGRSGAGRGEVRMIPAKNQIPPDPLPIRRRRAAGIMVEPHHLPALIHEPELGIRHQTFQRLMQPLLGTAVPIHALINELDSIV